MLEIEISEKKDEIRETEVLREECSPEAGIHSVCSEMKNLNDDGNHDGEFVASSLGFGKSGGSVNGFGVGYEAIVEEEGKVSGFGPATTIKVSGENLSLYVDLSVPVVVEDDHGNSNTPVIDRSAPASSGDEKGEDYYRNFVVGDVVWIRTKNHSWWPGKICSSGDATDECLMVEYLGSSHAASCSHSQLKFFHEIFHEVASKIRSRSFTGAVEKAVNEFGSLLRSEIACSCMISEGKDASRLGRFDEFSVSSLDPIDFLSQIREFGKSIPAINALDLAIIKARLSVIHKFLGRHQLPLEQLEELIFETESSDEKLRTPDSNRRRKRKKFYVDSDANHDSEKVEILPDSRERKKSKYLSFPFVQQSTSERCRNCEEEITENPAKEKHLKDPSLVSVSDLLSDLRAAAIDCRHLSADSSNVLEWFFSLFRAPVHNETAIDAAGEDGEEEEQKLGIPDLNHASVNAKEAVAESVCERGGFIVGVENLF